MNITKQNLDSRKTKGFCAVFFDFDGVIADSERLYQRFWSEAISEFGFAPKKEEILKLRSCDAMLGKRIMEGVYGFPFPYSAIRQRRVELMNDYLKSHPLRLKSGALNCLRFLKERGIEAYIVSSTPLDKLEEEITELGISQYIIKALSAKDARRGKPYPDVYLNALKATKLSKEDVLVIEDSPNGIASAFAAGLSVAMVDDLDNADSTRKNQIIFEMNSLDELINKDIFENRCR